MAWANPGQGLACKSDVCAPAECSDGITNDADALVDLFDPGCENSADDDESDDPVVPRQCSDGIDNDTDGDIDYPNDLGCAAAADDLEESCDDSDPILEILVSPLLGDSTGSTNDFAPLCQASSTAGDVAHKLVIDVDLESLTINTNGSSYDTVLTLNNPECSSAVAVACDDDDGDTTRSLITVANPPQGVYYVLVDGFLGNTGAYVLNVEGTIAVGGTCNPASTLFFCSAGETCDGGTNTCTPTACNDGINNDGDNFIDFPNDPGCDSISDDDETDDCPSGPNCPQCSNGIDDDGDTFVDFAADLGCMNAGDNLEESCTDMDPILTVNAAVMMGDTTGGMDDFTPVCQTNTTAPDHAYELFIPGELETLTVDTNGTSYDTVVYMRIGECSGADLVCDDDGGAGVQSLFTETDVPAGLYYIVFDAYLANAGPYTLNVNGIIKAGEACDPTQIAAGFLTCTGATTCTANICQ